MGEISINVNIADRVYPLRINLEEEENVRKAAKQINEKIKEYAENYSVKDKQDVLAMSALEFAVEGLRIKSKKLIEDDGATEKALRINQLLDDFLTEHDRSLPL